jgi:type IV pilus modification protein PilV
MHQQSGCSLIEALIAIAILAIGIVSVCQLFTIAVNSNLAATHRTHAAMLAAQKLEQLRSSAWGTEMQDGAQDMVAEYTRRWSVGPVPGNAANAVVLDVAVQWNRTTVAHLVTVKARRNP